MSQTVKVQFELPKELFLKGTSITQALIQAEALRRLAATFYADGSLSLGKAAKLANVSKQDFVDFLAVLQGAGRPGIERITEASWILTNQVKNQLAVSMLTADLDQGEAEAVVLAKELGADYFLVDEKKVT